MQRKFQLDGIRWFLFLMVFTLHHAPQKFEIFLYALPMFFVMSGYLISGILFKIDPNNLSSSLKKFYIRRTLRIFPAYYALVIVLWFSGALSYPISALTYTVNLNFFFSSIGPGAAEFNQWFAENWTHEATHLWSLSVEEQYYLIYPLLILLTPGKARVALLIGIILVSIVSRNYFIQNYANSYYGAFISPWEYFAVGGLAAWLQFQGKLDNIKPEKPLLVASTLLVSLVVVEFALGYKGWFQFQTTNFQTPIALLLAVFVWCFSNLPNHNPAVRFFSWKPFVFLGEMSYALYLWHLSSWAIYYYIDARVGLPNIFVSTLVITLALGLASRYLIENPALALKRRYE